MTAEERHLLQEIIAGLRLVERRWSEVEDVRVQLPRVLVHGDFLPHNMRVMVHGGKPCLFPFDWALAGWGAPVIDLAQSPIASDAFSASPDIAAYWSVVREHWPEVHFADIQKLANYATISQCLSAVHRDAPHLATAGHQKSMDNMHYYRETLEHTAQALGWE